jgi:succinate dehydrogenase hydrophobic anchor subunit
VCLAVVHVQGGMKSIVEHYARSTSVLKELGNGVLTVLVV